MNGISPWAASAYKFFGSQKREPFFEKIYEEFIIRVYDGTDSLWIAIMTESSGPQIAFRAAYSPGGNLEFKTLIKNENGIKIQLKGILGEYSVELDFPDTEKKMMHFCTRLKPVKAFRIPFWPKDILPLTNSGRSSPEGIIHAKQVGIRSGIVHLSLKKPQSLSVLYLQNLTALGDYCQETETSAGDTVGGIWPELGFSLPLTKEKPLPRGKEFVISDAYVVLEAVMPENAFEVAKQYLNLLAEVYKILPKPETRYQDYQQILDKSLEDLQRNSGCWLQANGRSYLNAYVCDYVTPPEIMVQLAVLMPMMDYMAWSKHKLPVVDNLIGILPSFFDKDLKTVMRWLPAYEGKLDESEEQKKPKVMDSWYLHHPLLNLSRMALQGIKLAEALFIESIEYAIKVAHHFKYQWPVFYKMDTLEVVKAETQEGRGGEKDVGGLYAHVMLQAWELTGQKRYLEEAKTAAQCLKKYGGELFYQANNTAFSAGAMLRLYKETRDELYINLSYLCLANLFKNVKLWNCNYGFGKYYPSYFGVFPLSDAPYTAVYEEQEVFAAFHDYLEHSKGVELLPSVKLLIAEFIRFTVFRAKYYYPANLPEEMLSEETKMGEVDRKLWIALEDLQDGWIKSGSVGQEVYGAGVAFGIIPRHYFKVPGKHWMIFTDYPVSDFVSKKDGTVGVTILGDKNLTCRVRIIPGNDKLPGFKVSGKAQNKKVEFEGKTSPEGHLEYTLHGDQDIMIRPE